MISPTAQPARPAPQEYVRTTDDGGHFTQSVAMLRVHDAKVDALRSDLLWGGNDDNASLRNRATYLNKLENFIVRAVPDTAAPLTMISHGSFGLLMEELAHKALLRRGYSNIRWRCIDPAYDNAIAPEPLAAKLAQCAAGVFAKAKSNVAFFPTESEYLGSVSAPSLAAGDREAGTTVIMAVAPEIDFEPARIPVGLRSLGGVVVDKAAQSNTAYLFYGAVNDITRRGFINMRSNLRKGYATLRDANWMVEAVVRPDQTLAVDRSLRTLENIPQRVIADMLETEIAAANRRGAAQPFTTPERLLQSAVRKTARNVKQMMPDAGVGSPGLRLATMTLMLNHPAVALERLHAFMRRGEQPAYRADLVADRVAVG